MRPPLGRLSKRVAGETSPNRTRCTYGQAVGQQLFRVLSYVLNHAEVTTHGTENAIVMIDWLLSDPELDFQDRDQRRRLRMYLSAFEDRLDGEPANHSAEDAFRLRLQGGQHTLG